MDTKLNAYDGVSKEIIITTPSVDCTLDPEGMVVTFFNKMRSHGQAIAQINGITGEKDTYASLLQRSVRTAIKMRSLGLSTNDIITICSVNHLDSCVPFLAALFLGAKIANLDPTISLNDTSLLLKQVRPKMIFIGEEALDLIENALKHANIKTKVIVFGKSTKHLQFSSFLLPSVAEKGFEPVTTASNKDTAVIYFSSGTTGLPKGICLNHYGLLTRAHGISNIGLNVNVSLGYASMYWISSGMPITCAILNKVCRVICPSYNPEAIWTLISKYKINLIFLAPIQAINMCKVGRPKNTDTSSLKQLLIGGGPISKEFIEQLRELLPETYVFMAYGQTETCCITSCFNLNKAEDMRYLKEKIGSSGKVIDGMEYKVVDIETEKTLGPYQKGELRVKSEYVLNGYYNMDSSQAWDEKGFLKTGDVVYYDEDYCLYIVDRVKDMLKFQMWHIPPALLEGVLLKHPAVQSAVVVGLPHPIDGDHPMGVVVLKQSYIGKITTEELQKFVDERVDNRQKLRGGIKIVDKIPLTPSGKLKRMYIRDLSLRGEF